MESGKNYVIGIYEDEDVLKGAIKEVKGKGIKIHEVFTPYPVHGLEDVLGYRRSRLPIAAFLFGLTGTILALTMMIYMLGIDWPMNIGGKDHIALPDFIPVTFELTVLLSAFGMVGTFFVVSNLKPYGTPKIFDSRSTDDKHVMAIDLAKNKITADEISSIISATGASEVNRKNFD